MLPCMSRLTLAFLLALLFHTADAVPSQYCHDQITGATSSEFCLAATVSHNHSTGAHDLWLSILVAHIPSTNKGWTAVGIGPSMVGSLMVVIYGDPLSGYNPTVSVRTVPHDNHQPPRLVQPEDTGATDIRVLQSNWQLPLDDGIVVAKVGVVCYGITLWPGTPIDATATSQPWIWAMNYDQELARENYSVDAQLEAHLVNEKGRGLFYVDMEAATSHDAFLPFIQPSLKNVGSTNTLGSQTNTSISALDTILQWKYFRATYIHGLLMGVAFLLLFPLGTVMIRSSFRNAFVYHWTMQVSAVIFTATGAIIGVILSGKRIFDSTHQVVGLVLLILLILQAWLGWRHHVLFLRLRRRTLFSQGHIWLGRSIMLIGATNVLFGLQLAGHGNATTEMLLFTAFIIVEALTVGFWVWIKTGKEKKSQPAWASRISERG